MTIHSGLFKSSMDMYLLNPRFGYALFLLYDLFMPGWKAMSPAYPLCLSFHVSDGVIDVVLLVYGTEWNGRCYIENPVRNSNSVHAVPPPNIDVCIVPFIVFFLRLLKNGM